MRVLIITKSFYWNRQKFCCQLFHPNDDDNIRKMFRKILEEIVRVNDLVSHYDQKSLWANFKIWEKPRKDIRNILRSREKIQWDFSLEKLIHGASPATLTSLPLDTSHFTSRHFTSLTTSATKPPDKLKFFDNFVALLYPRWTIG